MPSELWVRFFHSVTRVLCTVRRTARVLRRLSLAAEGKGKERRVAAREGSDALCGSQRTDLWLRTPTPLVCHADHLRE